MRREIQVMTCGRIGYYRAQDSSASPGLRLSSSVSGRDHWEANGSSANCVSFIALERYHSKQTGERVRKPWRYGQDVSMGRWSKHMVPAGLVPDMKTAKKIME